MRSTVGAFVFVLALSSLTCAQARPTDPSNWTQAKEEGVRAMYVGNEGVLLSHNGKAVLIDGLHREYGPAYLFPPPELLSAMETAKPPFDQVRAVLVSHVHLDHFHSGSVGLHLKNNPNARLVSSAQTMLEVGRNYAGHAAVRDRMTEVTPEWNQRKDVVVDGIKIAVLGMNHSGGNFWWVKNLGHIIELGGKKFFHFGDADMSLPNFAAFDLPTEKIDVAFVPYWFLLDENGRRLVRERIGAKTVVAVHIPPAEAAAEAEKLSRLFPGVISFVNIQQESVF